MRADNALSHLYDQELCVAVMKDGTNLNVHWDKARWCFYFADDSQSAVCNFDDIEEWRPASITV